MGSERAVDGVLLDAKRAADSAPAMPELRLAYARVLLRLGFRAAAWHELCAAEELGLGIPEEVGPDFTFERPPGQVWCFVRVPVAAANVAAPIEDARFPEARVRSGDIQLPLVMTFGERCQECNGGERACRWCNGSGMSSGPYSETEWPCSPIEICETCAGTQFVIEGTLLKKRGCKHAWPYPREAQGKGWNLHRCGDCGLVALERDQLYYVACGTCANFDCICTE